MGGSVRIPAAWCGLVGLKPSYGRIPLDFLPTQFDTIHHFGPLARTIEDARLFLSVAEGPTRGHHVGGAGHRPHRPARGLGRGPAARARRRPRALRDRSRGGDGRRESATALADAGAVVEEVDVGWTRELADAWVDHWGVYLAAIFGDKLDEFRELDGPRVVRLMDAGLALGAVDFKRIEFVRTRAWKQLRPDPRAVRRASLPTMSQVARPVDEDDFVWYRDRGDGFYHGLDMTCQFNFVSQCPALSVPAGWTESGLPIGLQIVASATGTTRPYGSARRWSDSVPGRTGDHRSRVSA